MCARIEELFTGCTVVDVACGTGYFTRFAARHAVSVTGFDANDETLALARAKGIPNAQFIVADAYSLPMPARPYDAALTTFWWSHIPKIRIEPFLTGLHQLLRPGASVFVTDNRYVEGNSTPISRKDEAGDTYQERRLENGTRFEVLKNFPGHEELLRYGERFGTDVSVTWLDHFWILEYRAR
jgi:demethylmenaquinone methyltransferase/2-methoxy-6-polyprenyl-1,4-benzoquinol methylase